MEAGSTFVESTTAPSRFARSKLVAPALPAHHVARAALCQRLDAPAAMRLVLGSAGSGKTTLLAEWFHQQPAGMAAWLSVDEGDRDAVRFWRGFLAAVDRCAPGFAHRGLDLLRLDPRVDHDVLESVLDAAAGLDRRVVIVVDDFHLAGPEIHAQMRFLLGRGVAPLDVAIGARVEPQLGLDRMRLAGPVTEIREADLRFGERDASAMMRRLGVALPADGLRRVVDRTEGWVAGLQLAGLVLHDTADPDAFVDELSGTHEVISHYLWSEVFAAQTVDVQRFLLDACVVDELSPSLAAALSPASALTLFDLEAANLFVRRTDPGGATFRFHQLFADMLRVRLRSDQPTELLLHKRAADWYDAHGDPVNGFRHRWRAGQRHDALRSVDDWVFEVVYDGLPAMSGVEHALTDDDIRAAPGPALSFALALMTSARVADGDRLAARIGTVAGGALAGDEQQYVAVRAIGALVLGDTPAASALGDRVDQQAAPDAPWPIMIKFAAAKARCWDDDLDGAADALRDVLPANASALQRMELLGTRAQLELIRGDLRDCAASIDECLAQLEREGLGPLTDGLLARTIHGTLLLQRADVSDAERLLRSAAEVDSNFRIPARVLAHVSLSRCWAADGRIDLAHVAVTDAYRLIRARPARSGLLDHVRRQHVRLLSRAGELDAAAAVLADHAAGWRRELLAAELDLAQGRPEAARRRIDSLGVACPATTAARLALALIEVQISAISGEQERAGSAAAAAFDIAAVESLAVPFVEAGAAVLGAVQSHARRLPPSAFGDTVLRLRPLADMTGSGTGPDALTERERAIVRYMATTLSYQEIADELFVSRNTVKTHVSNIKRKLVAGTRAAAVARAHQLGYL